MWPSSCSKLVSLSLFRSLEPPLDGSSSACSALCQAVASASLNCSARWKRRREMGREWPCELVGFSDSSWKSCSDSTLTEPLLFDFDFTYYGDVTKREESPQLHSKISFYGYT